MQELINIQSGLKANKSQYNKFGGYYYRSAEDILEAVKPLLKENKCFLSISDEIVMVGDRYYVKAIATLTNSENKTVQATAFAREEEALKGMVSAQITGSTSSYARKYALNGLFCIDDTKDADATNRHGKQPTLDDAISDANKANSLSKVTSVWKKYPQFHTEKKFVELISKKGNEFKKVAG